MKKIWSQTSKVLVMMVATFLLCTGIASAHVTVKPNISAPGAWETYTVKIPVEKDVPTTKVTLKIPDGMELVSYQPEQGWKVTLEKDASGKVKTVTWTAEGEGLLPGQFQQFFFVAKNPDKERKVAWDAYQYYKDGTIVEWTGTENSQTPHSVTEISQAAAAQSGHDMHSHGEQAAQHQAQSENKTNNEQNENGLSIATLVIAVIALIVSIVAFLKKRA
ncbi:YcnI family protein [Parageobacillus sp. VR-IP]|uniref:YcnI family copper-binding membrane protein n=1 Tax=Parageobacillus sp. VR-IP TaxID=2742205 RepID=UPI0015821894|nr:YcnI family protein [Parageobacillus sp. VR-IP]NUK31339.1 YcnI family protein [Parageobacillus sp. VR-IP]